MAKTTLRIGYVPLLDCAIPLVAEAEGFAARHGLALELLPEISWAAIRDKVAFGALEGAHMLAGIPLAVSLGVGLPAIPMVAPMALGLGGNAITVGLGLFRAMRAADPAAMAGPRRDSARALAAVIAREQAEGAPKRRFASVFPVSSHAYELRYWLASAGLDPDGDVELTVLPPSRMAESLGTSQIDGYCVGEPWSLVTLSAGIGAVVATKADIWPLAPEKVLGLRTDWADRNPEVLAALLRAFAEAAVWADAPENRPALARLLAPRLGVDLRLLETALCGSVALAPGRPAEPLPHRPVFHAAAATFPWRSQALWLLTQMARWGQIPRESDFAGVAAAVYRPDLYRAALSGGGLSVPVADLKPEGAHDAPYEVAAVERPAIILPPDRFIDGRTFDPSEPTAYLAGFGRGEVAVPGASG
ncbi:NitT/TauT family transport system ATP-binding protein/nitrate/nitrite transport system substrate-binding protein [Tistlia consotensis]|uniref:NitT/TauT family transport system ATP-binding protein/nitrate/nitrite transport system substrate-binding protein n=1 Tax=Tistlia consotensis USBA 355 TaxID=560819 RepID=A0A1Y6BYK9_9PROT|nr:CmpA/NrtA family ABC transporter substrate-binding protein [Tistlia consotensis]SMF36366.1 NitT/TauT family transport system ATP-binding protein/nitrate/nitrite transport system substrate-binding protein [Tistlia consotensis USBA 355]SNR71754.1 NitT/TauT family transport system ATP-binding protein/nitrate/nitrite transport system substrate-binding protein [Tistlia consotensis]